MTKELMERVLVDEKVQRTVRYFARGVARFRPYGMDQEDAEHEIWEAIFKSLDRWTGQKTLTDFARSAAFSKYGHLIERRINHGTYMNEDAVRVSDDFPIPSTDRSYEHVETGITLDSIEAILNAEYSRTRQQRIALKSIRLLRNGFSQSEVAEELGVSPGCVRMSLHRMRKAVTRLAGV